MYLSGISDQLLVGGWLSWFVTLTIFLVLVIKTVVPLAKETSYYLKLTREMGNMYDRHWLWGHAHKYRINSYEGLRNSVQRSNILPAMSANWIGPFHFGVMLYHPDVVKTLLTKPMPKSSNYKRFLGPLLRDGLVTSSGNLWKRHRRLLSPIFHFNVLKIHVEIFNKNCDKIILSFQRAAENNSVCDVHQDISHMTYNNMLECVMSQRCESQSDEDGLYIKALQEASVLIFERWGSPHLWPEIIFKRTKRGKLLKECIDTIRGKAQKIINERRTILEKMENSSSQNIETTEFVEDNKSFTFHSRKGKPIDFLDILLQTKDQDGVGLSDDEVIDEVTTFFSAGPDTVTNGLCWTLHFLASNPEEQQKCRDEIIEVIGSQSEVSWNDTSRFPYLTQCIKEALRLMPVIHAIARQLTEDVTFSHRFNDYKEITFKKGTKVAVNTYALHRNPHVWVNPETFNPDRFSPEKSAERSPFAFIPFAAGTRNCIGQHFAMHQMKVVLGQLLRRFEFYKDGETPEPIPSVGVTLQSSIGLKLKVRQW